MSGIVSVRLHLFYCYRFSPFTCRRARWSRFKFPALLKEILHFLFQSWKRRRIDLRMIGRLLCFHGDIFSGKCPNIVMIERLSDFRIKRTALSGMPGMLSGSSKKEKKKRRCHLRGGSDSRALGLRI